MMAWASGDDLTSNHLNYRAGSVFNIQDDAYGAIGDDSTDDVTAIESAINAANTAGGGVVYFPPEKTFLVSRGIQLKSNVTLHVDGTVHLADTAITDTDLFVFGHDADVSDVVFIGTGLIKGPNDADRRASGIRYDSVSSALATTDLVVGSGLRFEDLLAGINLQEVLRVRIGTCYYEDMIGLNVGGASASGSCIVVAGASYVDIAGVIGSNVERNAVYLNATGTTTRVPDHINVGRIVTQGPTQSGAHTAFTGNAKPYALAIRSGQYVNVDSVNCARQAGAVLIQREGGDTAAMSIDDVNIGMVVGDDLMEEGIKMTDLAATQDHERITIGQVILTNVGKGGISIATTNRVSIGMVIMDDVGNVTDGAGLSLSSAENCSVGDIYMKTVTGDGLNITNAPGTRIGSAYLDTIATSGAGFDGLVINGSVSDAENCSIGRLIIDGAGAYDYAINAAQGFQSPFRIDSLSIENAGTSGWLNQATAGNIIGGNTVHVAMAGAVDNYPVGGYNNRLLIINANLIADVAVAQDGGGAATHEFALINSAGVTLADFDTTNAAITQWARTPMVIQTEVGAVRRGLRLEHTVTGSPTTINQLALELNYFEMT